MDAYRKLDALKNNIKSLKKVAIAFSGGVDSTFLVRVAHDVLGENVVAVTAKSVSNPQREIDEAIDFVNKYSIKHRIISFDELSVKGFTENSVNRCYICKNAIFSNIEDVAKKEGIDHILEGSNYDDLGDFRPGMQALAEHRIISPLKDALLTKEEIRLLSREMGLNTWSKPSFACLATRFPYGETITRERLEMVGKAEQILLDLGFIQVRVRFHQDIARIEIGQDDFAKMLDSDTRDKIYSEFNKIGFKYTALDLKGYRTGSLNEGLQKET